MESNNGANVQSNQEAPLPGKKWRIVLLTVLVFAALAYGVCCALAFSSTAFFPNTALNGIPVGGLSAPEATQALSRALLEGHCDLYLEGESETRVAVLEFAEAVDNANPCDSEQVESLYADQHSTPLLLSGGRYLSCLLFSEELSVPIHWDESGIQIILSALTASLSCVPQDASYLLKGDNQIVVTTAKDGCTVGVETLRTQLEHSVILPESLELPVTITAAQGLTAQAIRRELPEETQNAGYDTAGEMITPDKTGVAFDLEAAQALLDEAGPGETVRIPAVIKYPAVTAAELSALLFRDVIGEARTHVSGTAARISNVKLSASSVNGIVLNAGETFSYNETVGQRTLASGYQPAPAYVKGETVDEIGGGICQTSSTLYLSCLYANLEIAERYPHRYAPAYIAWGMDATVSWGGPDYKFTNNTLYPVKIETVYSKGYLTVRLLGTKTDAYSVKMSNSVLSTTPWTTEYKDDLTLAPGTEVVKVTPYTGYKVEAYKSLYDGDGNLISTKRESLNDYKVRNKLILKGPPAEVPEIPAVSPVLPGTEPLPEETLPENTELTVPEDTPEFLPPISTGEP